MGEIPLLNHLCVECLNDTIVMDLCDALETKWNIRPLPFTLTPFTLIAPNSQLSVSTFHRIADLMTQLNCFQELDFSDLIKLNDEHAIALIDGLRHSTVLHTLNLNTKDYGVCGVSGEGILAIATALEENSSSILCKLDVSSDEHLPEISVELQQNLWQCLRRGYLLARHRVATGSTAESDQRAQRYREYTTMPVHYNHEVHGEGDYMWLLALAS